MFITTISHFAKRIINNQLLWGSPLCCRWSWKTWSRVAVSSQMPYLATIQASSRLWTWSVHSWSRLRSWTHHGHLHRCHWVTPKRELWLWPGCHRIECIEHWSCSAHWPLKPRFPFRLLLLFLRLFLSFIIFLYCFGQILVCQVSCIEKGLLNFFSPGELSMLLYLSCRTPCPTLLASLSRRLQLARRFYRAWLCRLP